MSFRAYTSHHQSVNSLLLSVTNLENFNKRADATDNNDEPSTNSHHNPNIIFKSNFYSDCFVINQHETSQFPLYEHRWQMLRNLKNIQLPQNAKIHDKEVDEISMASTLTNTNFTGKERNELITKSTGNYATCPIPSRFHQRFTSKTE